MTGYTGYNYDLSGAPIELTDVFKDPKALVPVVVENLTSMADGSAIEVEDGLLESALGENYDDLTWVVERDGVSFIFAASDIAPYAAGPLEARISFDKYPELFTGKYGPAEGSYVKKLSEYTQTPIDLDGDGTSEKILVTSVSEDEDAYRQSAIRIVIDGQSFDTEEEFYSQEPYFIHMADGRNYIYTVTGSDNDYPTLIVFEIKDKTPAKVGEMGDGKVGQVATGLLATAAAMSTGVADMPEAALAAVGDDAPSSAVPDDGLTDEEWLGAVGGDAEPAI